MPLLLDNREVAAAMRADEYVETMEEAFRELGAGRAVNGRATGRENADEITHHLNNNGCGMQFAAAGARILANARRMGLGTQLSGDFFLQKEHT